MSLSILIVDDSMPMRSVIKRTLKAAGYGSATFLEAENGKDALNTMKNSWVDVVITDYNMPVMDGLDFVRHIKEDEMFRTIPVIVVSTEGNDVKIQKFMESGASGYVTKPFAAETIRDLMVKLLGEVEYEQDIDDTDEGLDF